MTFERIEKREVDTEELRKQINLQYIAKAYEEGQNEICVPVDVLEDVLYALLRFDESLAEKIDRLASTIAENIKFREMIEKVEEQKAHLDSQSMQLQRDYENLKEDHRRACNRNKELVRQCDNNFDKVQQLEKENAELRRRIKLTDSQNTELFQKLNRKTTELNRIKREKLGIPDVKIESSAQCKILAKQAEEVYEDMKRRDSEYAEEFKKNFAEWADKFFGGGTW